MSPKTPKPPYVFPRQKPTAESGDEDGDIIIRNEDEGDFKYGNPGDLEEGDVWVPACFEFFDDWANGESDAKLNYAGEHWNEKPDED